MVAGRLQTKNGIYYTILSYKDESGKRVEQWSTTRLPEKGNKKKAQALLAERRAAFVMPKPQAPVEEQPLFVDYLRYWLETTAPNLAPGTLASYTNAAEKIIIPYFKGKKLRLNQVTPREIQMFYTQQLKRVKATTVHRYHANLHKMFKLAVLEGLLPFNPADRVQRPRAQPYHAQFASANGLAKIFAITKGTPHDLPVRLAAFYGLRRSEVLGLKWSAIDFEQNTISITHTVYSTTVDGKRTVHRRDSTKNSTSRRTLPLVDSIRPLLLERQKQEAENRLLCGNCYSQEYDGYIFVDVMGKLINDNYLTSKFPKYVEAAGLPRMRFHDLRHSCASLLLAQGISMKQIQEWLGHSDFSTTANIYAHLAIDSKQEAANALSQAISVG